VAVDAPEITGDLSMTPEESDALRLWLAASSTGEEYGRLLMVHRESLAALWGVLPRPSEAFVAAGKEPADELRRLALAMASHQPFVVGETVEPVQLTDELVDDVRKTAGLTYGQISQLFGISERAVAGWKQAGVPRHREPLMRALRAIGLILVGGLGPDGVALWLRSGNPSRLQRLAAGELDE
jgi:DNA-binding transcriptional regulator YiaG